MDTKRSSATANRHELSFKDETFQTVGAAMEVLNVLGHGLLEKPYERALVFELVLRGVPVKQQPRYQIVYKGANVGDYIPDVVAWGQIVIEVKCIDRITNVERAQVVNYLKIAQLPLGLIFNFRQPKLEWERIVL